MRLPRLHFLLSYFKTLSNGLQGMELPTSHTIDQFSRRWVNRSADTHFKLYIVSPSFRAWRKVNYTLSTTARKEGKRALIIWLNDDHDYKHFKVNLVLSFMEVKRRLILLQLAIHWLEIAWFVKSFWWTCLWLITLQFIIFIQVMLQ